MTPDLEPLPLQAYTLITLNPKGKSMAWRNGSAIRSTGGFLRGPEFNSRCPHDGSHLAVPPVPGELVLFRLLQAQTAHGTPTYI